MASWEERHEAAAAYVIPFLDRTVGLAGAHVLEFGAGSGPISCALAPQVASVLGLDIAEPDVELGRQIAAERGLGNIELHAGDFEGLLKRANGVAGEIDLFLLYAVLEHMTIAERLAVLRTARAVLRPGGSLCVFETPNRLLWWDHHTSQLPFFGMLEEPLALAYAARSPRGDFKASLAPDDPEAGLTLTRAGRGVSQHEFELALGPLAGLVVAGGYEPELFPIRHVHREELYLARFLARLADRPTPVFSRYWLDLVIRFDGRPRLPLIEPWPFATDRSHSVAVTPWETLEFMAPDAWLEVPAAGAQELHLGVEGQRQALTVTVDEAGARSSVLQLPPSTGTEYVATQLSGTAASIRFRSTVGSQLSFIGLRGAR